MTDEQRQELAKRIHAYCVEHYEQGYDVYVECYGVSGIEDTLREDNHTTFAQWHKIAAAVVDVRADRQADADHQQEY
jgi:hypothetical protein